jgi:hypothetical protein
MEAKMHEEQPIAKEYRAMLNAVASAVDEFLNGKDKTIPKKNGFVILMFPFGDNDPHRDRINYISNGERGTVIVAMKELIARFEGRLVETETKQ